MKIYPIKGIEISSLHSGMYEKKRLDLSLVKLSSNCIISSAFTRNKAKSSCIIFNEKNLKKSNPKYLIINSGNANAGTGKYGMLDIKDYCSVLKKISNCKMSEILVFSTGVIGERIKYKNICESIPKLYSSLKEDNWVNLSKSIMTTDTQAKIISNKIKIKNEYITITGVAKGSGMIKPNMATMLSFVATNLSIDKKTIKSLHKKAIEDSYNMITVDGETSTNDSSLLISSRTSTINYKQLSENDKKKFYNAIIDIYKDLAKKIIKDGEGATKFISINIKNASSVKEAKNVGMHVGNSLLVKTALFAEDANWGRILSAIGNSEIKSKDLSNIEISFGKFKVFKNNEKVKSYNEKNLSSYLKNKEIEINITLNTGKSLATVWTNDLSYEYIKINAEYRT